jgi:hypothetical protein
MSPSHPHILYEILISYLSSLPPLRRNDKLKERIAWIEKNFVSEPPEMGNAALFLEWVQGTGF